MAIRQSLKGSKEKTYEIINNFNKGYNTSISDGVLADNVFRELVNFEIKEEGIISKRKGLKNNGLNELIKMFYDLKTDPTEITDLLNPGITFNTVLTGKLNGSENNNQNAYNEIFKMLKDTVTYIDEEEVSTNIDIIHDKIAHLKIFDDKMLKEYQEHGRNILLWDISCSIDFEIVLTGYYMFKELASSYLNPVKKDVFKYIRCKLTIDNASSLISDPYITLTLDVKIDKTTAISSKINLINKKIADSGFLKMINYNDKSYFATGYGLYQTKDGILTKINTTNAYKPNAIEVSNIGFNILSSSPLTHVDSGTGSTDSIKGVFLTYNGEPTLKIPSSYSTTENKEFKINVIHTGSGALSVPKYRFDNGEVDETKNPYKEMIGSYTSNVFTCTNFSLDGKFEIKIEKANTDPHIGFYTAEPQQAKEIGKINDICNLINSSLYCMIMNNQLVLYGGHGYIFFSEFDNFYYFPNYNYIYAIDESIEEVNAIKYFRQFYAVSIGNKKFKRLSGNFPFEGEGDGLFPLNDFVGCSNTNTIRQIENNLVFLSNNGLYLLKQGYTGEGTENIQQIDLSIIGDYDKDKVINAVVKGNNYILTMGNIVLLFNYVLGAYYKYIYNITEVEGYTATLSGLFEKDEYGLDFYICKIINKTADDTKELKILDFEADDIYTDDGKPYSTYFKMSKVFFGSPTNEKKFKNCIIKGYNEGNGLIPMYITIKVDDVPIITPETYFVRVDSDTNYIYYEKQVNSNGALNLKIGAVLGEMVLGETLLGSVRSQNVKTSFDAKGKSVSLELYDIYQGEEETYGNNTKPFSISDVGFIYKLKKVKGD